MDITKNIGFGCVALTAQPFESGALKLLEICFENGIRHFDTAPLYGQGYSEKILGKFIKRKREEITITTKFGLSPGPVKNIPGWMALPLNNLKKKITGKKNGVDKPVQISTSLPPREITQAEVKRSFINSLKNLNTDYIDYYLLHEAIPKFLDSGVIEYLLDLKNSGFIKKIGIATSAINFRNLMEPGLENWDILQYENEHFNTRPELLATFPAKQHFHHSILKQLKNCDPNIAGQQAGALLSLALQHNPGGKILFSTTSANHLINNLRHVERMVYYSEDKLKNILS